MFLAKFMPKSAKNSKIFDLIIKKLPRNNSD